MAEFINTVDVLGDDALTDSIIDRSITEYCDDSIKNIAAYAFSGCSALTTANFPVATKVDSNAFQNCSALTTANFPVATKVDSTAFSGCSKLTTADFPVATSVGSNAFSGCSKLTTADFPVATSVGSNAFYNCYKLVTFILRNTTKVATLSSTVTFNNTPIKSGTGYIYVPRDLVDSYKATTNWSTYANQFRAIEDYTIDGTVTGEMDIENRRMVRFFNNDGTLLGYKVVAVGSDAVWDGDTPVYSDDPSWAFKGFLPEPTNVTADMDCYAQYQEPFSLETASWAEISEISAEGTAANYMSVGDTKSVALKGTMDTLALDGTYFVYILGFNHNSEVEGTGIQFGGFKSDAGAGGKDICLIDSGHNGYFSDGTKYFNQNHWGSNNYGGWAACDMRYDILGSTDVQPSVYGVSKTTSAVGYDATSTCATNPVANTLMSCLPADLRAVMKPITKWTNNVGQPGDTEAKVTATIDYLPLLAEFEIFGTRKYANSYEQNHQQQYAYFAAGNSRVKYCHSATGSTAYWWGRSPHHNYHNGFCGVYTDGSSGGLSADNSNGVAPAFMV